ncbi:MAG: hypothetical protein CMLOHMNK_01629 [Steroidobacteraceae bacterium]|nr:hypothetical protein [Steroidobacteraceae bacterium]
MSRDGGSGAFRGWRGWLFATIALVVVYQWVASRPLQRRPGVLAPDEPVQTAPPSTDPVDAGHGYKVIPRAHFSATVRVLARERYYIDPLAPIAPVDLAVGWGRMSDSAVLASFDISQSNRFYYWHADELPIPRGEIESHSANWHIVPASAAVDRALRRARPGEVLQVEGSLVDVEGPDGGSARTSLRRDDTGAGACEIILADRLDPVGG